MLISRWIVGGCPRVTSGGSSSRRRVYIDARCSGFESAVLPPSPATCRVSVEKKVLPQRSSVRGLVLEVFSRFWLRIGVISTGGTFRYLPPCVRFELAYSRGKVTKIRQRHQGRQAAVRDGILVPTANGLFLFPVWAFEARLTLQIGTNLPIAISPELAHIGLSRAENFRLWSLLPSQTKILAKISKQPVFLIPLRPFTSTHMRFRTSPTSFRP